ncbi:CDP-diacylglycerol--serine O-phosphatidyltransferase [Acanthopleuribacter pedis]|uniref:CDP-diacylglycerol--serine O-phosphatidyltransferase n=1 Tax=Acanthopleuribacter pedis TaxID=442870 RepID=A0A8J7QMS3_9BACT|nr:CDP-diacylglycerol--serine O-phosphatidyltransferase [Acanthopleuribacter pedis]MBO1321263.1 CDP-diacylglycerol--serine O-phosphatidyltransferase [Acanthopleuribacter pedis]
MVGKYRRRRNVKIIFPSTITSFAMVFGFISIMLAANGDFVKASYMLMLSMVMDGLDGKVARMTNTASEFGIQYDSLSDLIAFGLAPAFIYARFVVHAQGIDRMYYLLPMMFMVCGAIRLARFNITASIYGKTHFTGLPIPAASFALILWPPLLNWAPQSEILTSLGVVEHLTLQNLFPYSIGLIVLLSWSMISTLKFDTPGGFWFHKFPKKWMNWAVIAAFLSLNIWFHFSFFCLAIATYYLLFMYARAFYERVIKQQAPPLEDEENTA